MIEPPTILPFTRFIRRAFSSLKINNAIHKDIKSSEIDWLHDPAIKTNIDIFLSFVLEESSGDCEDWDSRILFRCFGEDVGGGVRFVFADHLGGCVSVGDWHLLFALVRVLWKQRPVRKILPEYPS